MHDSVMTEEGTVTAPTKGAPFVPPTVMTRLVCACNKQPSEPRCRECSILDESIIIGVQATAQLYKETVLVRCKVRLSHGLGLKTPCYGEHILPGPI